MLHYNIIKELTVCPIHNLKKQTIGAPGWMMIRLKIRNDHFTLSLII